MEAGYVGEDVESILYKLLMVADYNVEATQQGIVSGRGSQTRRKELESILEATIFRSTLMVISSYAEVLILTWRKPSQKINSHKKNSYIFSSWEDVLRGFGQRHHYDMFAEISESHWELEEVPPKKLCFSTEHMSNLSAWQPQSLMCIVASIILAKQMLSDVIGESYQAFIVVLEFRSTLKVISSIFICRGAFIELEKTISERTVKTLFGVVWLRGGSKCFGHGCLSSRMLFSAFCGRYI
ncbi:hypothetical protein RHGRI_010568 [Rhododendron griersonianum]|uniref:Uncharacterized protein n=1 Tax=Rhododendron griersonianum TaxID=479676 RepID=A0AAV6KJ06_9ERIC|nr:hypothetical protein RHGRI_010568 [Rhododendron griersonianum]